MKKIHVPMTRSGMEMYIGKNPKEEAERQNKNVLSNEKIIRLEFTK